MKITQLIPPDPKQCQCMRSNGSFMTFGPVNRWRCENKAAWIAKEREPGSDGLKGVMSLCDECKEKFLEKKGISFAYITPV